MLRTDKKKHLICFFDINDTMFIGDSVKNVSKKISIMKMLAEHYVDVWDASITTRSMTFREFVEKYLSPGDRRIAEIQQAHNNHYENFLDFLEAKQHALSETIRVKFIEISAALKDGYIPPSFIKMIRYLQENQYPFTIIFRTFGHDIEDVKKELAQFTSIQSLKEGHFSGGILTLDEAMLESPEAMLRSIEPHVHSVWQDNFKDWRATGENYSGGKPFPVAFDRDDVVTIFFDDNVMKRILRALLVGGSDFDQASLQQYLIEQGNIVSVDTFAACTNPDYFIDKVKAVYHARLRLSQYMSLADNGKPELDVAVFCWALQTLHPAVNLDLVKKLFSLLEDAYQDNERFFHRGLGHPRSLLPPITQMLYKTFSFRSGGDTVETLIHHFEHGFTTNIHDKSSLIKEAREILAAFYHDVVHRRGKKPSALLQYLQTDGSCNLLDSNMGITRSLIGAVKAEKAEALSCVVAEDALRQLNIPNTHVAAILLAIYATIPFDELSQPDNLKRRMEKVWTELNIPYCLSAVCDAVDSAVNVSNRDLGSYGSDTLDEFNKKTWAMMLERNNVLANHSYSLIDEATTIAKFYNLHKSLRLNLQAGSQKIFHSRLQDNEIDSLNEHALTIIDLDIVLQGVQLASLAILMAILTRNNPSSINYPIGADNNLPCIYQFLSQYPIQVHDDIGLPLEVANVLANHGKECVVNGVAIMRGNMNANFALRLTGMVGLSNMLSIADKYTQFADIDLDALFNKQQVRILNVRSNALGVTQVAGTGISQYGAFRHANTSFTSTQLQEGKNHYKY